MVAIFTSAGTGFERGSGSLLGAAGLVGSAAAGRGGEQLFLNAATGNLLINQRDEFLAGRGLDVAAGRTYNSLGDLSDDNGDNWRLSIDRRVYGLTGTANSSGSTVHRVSADGTDLVYSWDVTQSAYVAKDGPGAYDKLTYNGGGWTWTEGDSQVKETYSASGSQWLISSQADADGNAISFTYANGRLFQVTSANGEYVQYDWSGNNLVDLVTGYTDQATGLAATLTRTRYSYDAQNRLQTVTVDLSPNDNAVADGVVHTTTYEYAGTSTRVSAISQSDGSRIDVTYDASNRVATISQTVSAGVARVTTLAYAAGYTTVTDALGQVTRLDYDAAGNLTRITMPAASSAAAPQVTQFAYDANGNVTSVTDALGNITTYSNYSNGLARTVTDRLGSSTTRTFGSKNELLTETTTGADETSTSASHTVRYVYDAENHLRYRIGASGQVSEYRYTASGLLEYSVDYPEQSYDVSALLSTQAPTETDVNNWRDAIADKSSAQLSYNLYDARGNLIESRRYSTINADGSPSTADGYTIEYYGYDQAGKLLSHRSLNQNSEAYVYDGLGRLVSAVDVNGGTTSYVFNDAGTKTIVTLASGLVQTSTYDLAGQLVSFAEAGAASSPPAVTGTTAYGYDQVGRMRWELDATGKKAYHLYDSAGRRVADVSAAGEMVEYKIDANNRTAATVHYASLLSAAQLAGLDNQNAAADIASLRPAGSSSDLWSWTVFDKEGRVVESIAGDGSATLYSYDASGRLIKTTDCANKFTAAELDGFKSSPPLQATTTTTTSTYHAPPPSPAESANLLPDLANSNQWTETAGVAQTSTAAINGQPAWLYQVAAGTAQTLQVQGRTSASPGDTFTWTMTMMATAGSAASHDIQMATSVAPNSPTGVGMAVIASGPGTIVRNAATGGWAVTGLSTTEATTITVTRTFANAAVVYLDVTLGRTATTGDALILSSPIVTRCNEVDPPYLPPSQSLLPDLADTAQWSETNLSQTASTAISGQPAWKYSATAAATSAAIGGRISVQAGDTLSWTVTVQPSVRSIPLRFQLSKDGGASGLGTMTRVSGVGILSQNALGYWTLSGASLSTPTVLRITHSFTSAATVDLQLLLNSSASAVAAGDSVIVSNPVVTVTPGSALTGYTTTSTVTANSFPQPASNTKDISSRNFFDKDGLLIGTLDGAGFFTQYIYDEAGRKIDEIAFANAATNTSGTFSAALASVTADSAKDRHTRFVRNGQGQLRFVVDAENQLTETQFDLSGRATAVIGYANALASTTTDFSYDNVKALVAAAGFASPAADRRTWSVYDSAGRLAYAIGGEGAVTAFDYNKSGQVTKTVEYATGRATASLPSEATMDAWIAANANSASDRVTRNYYDGAGVLRYVVDAKNYVTFRTEDAEGRLTKIERFPKALTVALTDSSTINDVYNAVIASAGIAVATSTTVYDSLGRVASVADGEGYASRYVYNANGTLQSKTAAYGTVDASTIFYEYDAAGRVSKERRAYGTAQEAVTQYGYDSFGNAVSITDPRGVVTYNYYDKANNLFETCNDATAQRYVTKRSFNAFGEMTSETRHYNWTSNVPTETVLPVVPTSTADQTTAYAYDQLGRRTTITDAAGTATQMAYDAFGELVSSTRGAAVTLYFYDRAGRQSKVTDALNIDTSNSYNTFGELTSVLRGTATTSFDYDQLGRLTQVTDAEGYFEQYTLDAFGNRVKVLNKLGGTIVNTFDNRGLLLTEKLPMQSVRSNGTVQASSVTNKFTYDGRGNRKTMIEALGLTEQRSTTYSYDKLDRLTAKSGDALSVVSLNNFTSTTAVTVGTQTAVPTESYAYDAGGNLIQVTDANGASVFSYYDGLNRKVAELKAVNGSSGTLSAWTYDAFNKRSATVYGDLVALPSAAGGTPPAPVDAANCRSTNYGYDKLNRLTLTSIDNVLVGTWSSTNNGVSSSTVTVSSTIGYDINGNVIQSSDFYGNNIYSWYDKLGRKTDQLDALNYLTHWTYDGEGNVLSETRYATKFTGTATPAGAAPTVAADAANDRVTNFTYDKNGNRKTETRTGVAIGSVNGTNGALTTSSVSSTVTYTYNGLGQVTSKKQSTGDKVNYVYDGTGRLLTESRTVNALAYAYLDQAGAQVTPTVNYYYDGLNNLARTQQGGATLDNAADRITTYSYGAGGRLAAITNPDGGVRNYDYDAIGNLVRDSYVRTRSDGSTVTEGIVYERDLIGRVIAQAIATRNTATSWTRGDSQNSKYNAYGDISQRGVNGLWQESFTYNNRGLVEKTNSGDGVWRFFVYDRNGQQLMMLESEGNDYGSTSLGTSSTAGTLLYSLGTYAGSTYVDGVGATVNFYDGRGQTTLVYRLQRETAAGAARQSIGAWTTYNAFGEVASESDGEGYTTNYSYNTMGRLTKKVMPQVTVMSATGVSSTVNPTEYYYYDAAGRRVATKDANNNIISQTLLAGSGYDGKDALQTAEFHPDTGIRKTAYDVFGDARTITDELNRQETRVYDDMGRVVTVTHRTDATATYATNIVDYYGYDVLGQRITHWNSALGSTVVETTDYDLQGRVVSTKEFSGDLTSTSYSWDGTLTNSGMSGSVAIGGWTKQTTQWAQLGSGLWKQKSETTDVHGLTTSETDLGGNTASYNYDRAGRLTSKVGVNSTTNAGQVVTTTLAYTYFNTGLVATVTDTASVTAGYGYNAITSTFGYDKRGLRTAERYSGTVFRSLSDTSYGSLTSGAQTLEDATINYDGLGRLSYMSSTSSKGTVQMWEDHDAAGNVRRIYTTVPNLVAGGTSTTDKWYTYDAMNRMVIVDGYMSGSTIMGGSALSYDVAGNRKTATTNGVTQTYYYDGDNQVTKVIQGGSLVASTTRDLLGRVTSYVEYASGGPSGIATNRYNIRYNARNQVTSDTTFHWVNGSDDYTAYVTNSYDPDYGLLARMDANNDGAKNTWQTWTYAWTDQAVVRSSQFDKEALDSGNRIYNSTQYYDGLGRLQRAQIVDGKPREVHFALNSDGQVLSRVQNDGTSNDPAEYHLYAGGIQTQVYTNDNGSELQNYDYAALIGSQALAASGSGRFYQGASTGTVGGEFGTSGYDPINSITAGALQNSRSKYVVEAGDTLQGIAAQVWGDSSLWYLIANANGLSGPDAALSAGQSLSLPFKGPSSASNADMYRPYDATSAIGDLSPTSVKPPKHNKCGAFGQILLVAIAVAVTALTYGALTGPTTTALGAIGAGAASGAAGSVVSQGVGVATGIQQNFSLKAVALSAVAGGVSAGVGQALGQGAIAGSQFAGDAIRGAIGNAVTQGIGVATGLQDKFDWAGVAAAGLGAGLGNAFARDVLHANPNAFGRSAAGYAGRAATSMASAVANAATRSVLSGTDFGDNILAALPDVIGQTVGGAVADAIYDPSSPRAVVRSWRKQEAIAAGLQPGTPEFKAYVAANHDTDVEFAKSISSLRRDGQSASTPGEVASVQGRLATLTENAGREYFGATDENIDDYHYLTGGASESRFDPITGQWETIVTKDLSPHGVAVQSLADPLLIKTGNLALYGAERLNNLLDSSPALRATVTLLDVGLKIAGGPARLAIGEVVSQFQGKAAELLTDQFASVGYDQSRARAGGVGGPITLSALATGFAGALKMAGILPGIGGRVPNAGGVIRSFSQSKDQIYYRVFSDRQRGSFLTAVRPRNSAFAREALALPPGNSATLVQEVLVPAGTRIQRSRALPAFGRRGGAEQFELLSQIPNENFGPGVPLP